MFFKPKPNINDGEKARIEYHLQQIADVIGWDRMQLPILGLNTIQEWAESKSPETMIGLIGEHLNRDVAGVGFQLDPQQLQQCGGGG